MEHVLKEELAVGKSYKSATDFYNQHTHYIVMDDGMSEAEIAEGKEVCRRADEEELARLQVAYADRWAA
jgi:hypothetical protein